MKNFLFYFSINILVSIFIFSCSNKKIDEETIVPENEINIESESATNFTNENEKNNVDTIETIQFISETEFITKISDIHNQKGFQYKGTMPCIVDFYADWCRPCHALTPILEDIAMKYRGQIIVYKLNVDKAMQVAQAFSVRSIPTLVFFKPHTMPAVMEGAPPQEELEKAISQLLLAP